MQLETFVFNQSMLGKKEISDVQMQTTRRVTLENGSH